MLFGQCRVQPSRSAILTGRTPHRNGCVHLVGGRFPPPPAKFSEITLPRLLKQAGYATCHVGKWHLNGLFNDPAQPQPNDHGYEWWLATQNNAAPTHENPNNFVRNGQAVGRMEGYSPPGGGGSGDMASRQTRFHEAFFLAVWTHEPPTPSSPPGVQKAVPAVDRRVQVEHHANVTQMDARSER